MAKKKKSRKRKRASKSDPFGFYFGIPRLANIDYTLPKVELPKIELPKIKIPKMSYDLPQFDLPKIEIPKVSDRDSLKIMPISDSFGGMSKGISTLSDEIRKRKIKKRLPEYTKKVVEIIETFKPLRAYRNEDRYRMELVGWLKGKDLGADIEVQKGYSRPDIVIGNIAIEVKGPTRKEELKTIADKCSRYTLYFDQLIVVLFEVEVDDGFYNEWYRAMQKRFPDVVIIRK